MEQQKVFNCIKQPFNYWNEPLQLDYRQIGEFNGYQHGYISINQTLVGQKTLHTCLSHGYRRENVQWIGKQFSETDQEAFS